jgi:predicted flap endonuclease-1-like 5' DNA nuclease
MICDRNCALGGLLILAPWMGGFQSEIEAAADLPGWAWLLFFAVALLAIFWWWWVTRPGQLHEVHELESHLGHGEHDSHNHAGHAAQHGPAAEPPIAEVVLPVEAEPGTGEVMAAPLPSEPFGDVTPDDLTRIEGIGPKIAGLLRDNGVLTFDQLSRADVAWLNTLLEGARLQMHDPGTWPEQAALAAAGKWDEFRALTDQLKGGRKA